MKSEGFPSVEPSELLCWLSQPQTQQSLNKLSSSSALLPLVSSSRTGFGQRIHIISSQSSVSGA